MKARTRCCSMRSTTTTTTSSAAAAAGTPFYLKPGALAQMRNSKITAKSIAKEQKALLKELAAAVAAAASTAPPPQPSYESMESIPFFGSRSTARHPRCLLRKKLVPMAPVFAE